MAEKIEFISAAELPVAEGDEVSVLCVENGEMKQKPATGLGDGGLLTVNITMGDTNWGYPSSVVFDKTFAEIKNAMDNGFTVIGWVATNQFTGATENQYCGGYLRPAFPIYGKPDGSDFIFFFPTAPDYVSYYIRPDGETGCIAD